MVNVVLNVSMDLCCSGGFSFENLPLRGFLETNVQFILSAVRVQQNEYLINYAHFVGLWLILHMTNHTPMHL